MSHRGIYSLRTLSRYLWAGPNTVVGLAAAAASVCLPRVRGSVALCHTDRGLAHWFLTKRGYCAITLGHLIIMTPQASEGTLSHELIHVRQAERWGPLFLPAYLVAGALTRMRGKDPYWDNPFEMEALRHQHKVETDAPSQASS